MYRSTVAVSTQLQRELTLAAGVSAAIAGAPSRRLHLASTHPILLPLSLANALPARRYVLGPASHLGLWRDQDQVNQASVRRSSRILAVAEACLHLCTIPTAGPEPTLPTAGATLHLRQHSRLTLAFLLF